MHFEAVASIFPEALPETTASIIGNVIKGCDAGSDKQC
jgi:hypothetical protein